MNADFSAGTAPFQEHSCPEKPRRVGTFTLGVVLVLSGIAMLLCMFFPTLDLTVLLKLSPLILVSLGAETLLAARRGSALTPDNAKLLVELRLGGNDPVLCAGVLCPGSFCHRLVPALLPRGRDPSVSSHTGGRLGASAGAFLFGSFCV